MLAAPLVFLFGALFVTADSVFQDYVRSAVPDPGTCYCMSDSSRSSAG
jgi:hypothetical protein